MTKKIESMDSVVVSSGVLAKTIGVTDRMIREYAKDEILVKAGHGKYKFIESITRFIVHLKSNTDAKNYKPDDGIDKDEEQAKHERVKREMSEMKLAEMKGDMHRSDDVERVMNDMLASFRAKMLNIPSKVAPMLVDRSDAIYIESILRAEVSETLIELSDYDPSNFYSEKYIDVDEQEVGDEIGEAEEGSPSD